MIMNSRINLNIIITNFYSLVTNQLFSLFNFERLSVFLSDEFYLSFFVCFFFFKCGFILILLKFCRKYFRFLSYIDIII